MIIELEKLPGENKKDKVGKITVLIDETIQMNDTLMQIEIKKGIHLLKVK